jgi:hypothetical protein
MEVFESASTRDLLRLFWESRYIAAAGTTQKTSIIVETRILRDCLATSLDAYFYSNGLHIVVMQ